MAEALLVEEARDSDRAALTVGVAPAAVDRLRAALGAPADPTDDTADDDDGDEPGLSGASITQLADWVDHANHLIGGNGG
ncbi:MAG TPA: hypothetical protein VHT75_04370 [Acidimicrobiales bacterium]|nr:hypothetical protein [Acidimicrobiales bacterium]